MQAMKVQKEGGDHEAASKTNNRKEQCEEGAARREGTKDRKRTGGKREV